MNLPVYQNITIKSASLDELQSILNQELNLRHPVVFNLLKFLDHDQQREFVGLIENYFVVNGISFKFPYPVYVLTEHESTISGLSLIRTPDELPDFFAQKEGKLNVKETHLLTKNKLLQQDIQNGDNHSNEMEIRVFGKIHRQIFILEEERLMYQNLLKRLSKAKANG